MKLNQQNNRLDTMSTACAALMHQSDDMQIEYTERSPISRRHYKLHNDQIVISGKPRFGSEFEAVVPISSLRKEKDTVKTRTEAIMILCAVPGILMLVLVFIFGGQIIDVSEYLFYALLALSVFVSGIGFLVTKKKKSYVYHNTSGALAFDISESGNSVEDFESFCLSLEEKITAYQDAAHNGRQAPV